MPRHPQKIFLCYSWKQGIFVFEICVSRYPFVIKDHICVLFYHMLHIFHVCFTRSCMQFMIYFTTSFMHLMFFFTTSSMHFMFFLSHVACIRCYFYHMLYAFYVLFYHKFREFYVIFITYCMHLIIWNIETYISAIYRVFQNKVHNLKST